MVNTRRKKLDEAAEKKEEPPKKKAKTKRKTTAKAEKKKELPKKKEKTKETKLKRKEMETSPSEEDASASASKASKKVGFVEPATNVEPETMGLDQTAIGPASVLVELANKSNPSGEELEAAERIDENLEETEKQSEAVPPPTENAAATQASGSVTGGVAREEDESAREEDGKQNESDDESDGVSDVDADGDGQKDGDDVDDGDGDDESGEIGDGGKRDGDDGDGDGDDDETESDEAGMDTQFMFSARKGRSRRFPMDFDKAQDKEFEATEAIKPSRMYFLPTEYRKQIKLGTRCFIEDAVTTLRTLQVKLSGSEMRWFVEHPQFRHFFHGDSASKKKVENHKVQGMWMLLLRNAEIEKRNQAWFIVNGVPIRYGLREHALISGLNCKNYPMGYKEFGSLALVKKHFKNGSIRLEDVKAKLMAMGPHKDRLNIAVLFFLASVVCAQTKSGAGAPNVLEFFQRACGDLDYCREFPWGRYSFDYMMMKISHTMDHFGGQVNEGCLWPLPGFCVPLELLAFEAIAHLGEKFCQPVPGADVQCPRMCRSKFIRTDMKGFRLDQIYQELGTSKDIDSILPLKSQEEKELLDEIMDEEDEDGQLDLAVDSWQKRLREGLTVFFPDMYEEDIAARAQPVAPVDKVMAAIEGSSSSTLEDVVRKGFKKFGKELKKVEKKVVKMGKQFEQRFAAIEESVKAIQKGKEKAK